MNSTDMIIVVTGANKGIGYATVKRLALEYKPPNEAANRHLIVYLTARSAEKGEEAVHKLLEDEELKENEVLVREGGNVEIAFHQLDITDPTSRTIFKDEIEARHGGIDVLINNAGVYPLGSGLKSLTLALTTNLYGTLSLTKQLSPLLRTPSHIINIASTLGTFSHFPPSLSSRLSSCSTIEDVTTLMEEALTSRQLGHRADPDKAWAQGSYSISKAGVIALTRVLAKREDLVERGVRVNCVCPGWTRTGMTFWTGRKGPEESCETVVGLALGRLGGGPTGEFWRDGVVVEM